METGRRPRVHGAQRFEDAERAFNRALEEAIVNFAGCVVVTSHDRWFLDRLATHILAFEGDGQVRWHEGNYADFEAHAEAD